MMKLEPKRRMLLLLAFLLLALLGLLIDLEVPWPSLVAGVICSLVATVIVGLLGVLSQQDDDNVSQPQERLRDGPKLPKTVPGCCDPSERRHGGNELPKGVLGETSGDVASGLPVARRNAITATLRKALPRFVRLRRHHLRLVVRAQRREQRKRRVASFKDYAWVSYGTAPSAKGTRLSFGFKNLGCSYWKKSPDHIGCYSCGYATSVIHGVSRRDLKAGYLITQMNKALSWANEKRREYDVIDVSSDGSFFNPEEYPKGFQTKFLKKIAEQQHVKTVLVESRPEHINAQRLRSYVHSIGNGQRLEIGIGLESADDFVKNVCIHKGFTTKKFESALATIAEYSDRCTVVVYLLFKPAFLNEIEAINDAVNTIKYLAGQAARLSLDVVPKIEPAFICEGTLLDLLHFYTPKHRDGYYDVPSYWSVIEVIAQCEAMGLHGNLRIGARQDMGNIKKIPGVYNRNGTFNEFDFWLYDAVQEFVVSHDIIPLLADIEYIFERDNRQTFTDWKDSTQIQSSAIEASLEKFKDEIAYLRGRERGAKMDARQRRRREREVFLANVFEVLDQIELPPESQDFAARLWRAKCSEETRRERIQEFIDDAFEKGMPERHWNIDVRSSFFDDAARVVLRANFDVTYVGPKDKACDEALVSRSIWVGIPTKQRQPVVKRLWRRLRY